MAQQEHFFITGALGCIGSWVVRCLVREGVAVTVFDLADRAQRMELIMTADEIGQVRFVRGDITDPGQVEGALRQAAATHIVHLAALQVPMCKANPVLGAQVNVVGTVNLLEAARTLGIGHLAYASSAAVYGIEDEYPEGPVGHEAPLRPRTLYGVYKQANEGCARVYWLDHHIASIGIRPYVVYGPGRDQGMTSTPTKAMLAAVLGQPYHISFGGRFAMQYAEDVARIFIQAARATVGGAHVYNLGGEAPHMQEVVDAICAVRPDARGGLTFAEQSLPFPPAFDDAPLQQAIGALPKPTAAGVEQTMAIFAQAVAAGRLDSQNC